MIPAIRSPETFASIQQAVSECECLGVGSLVWGFYPMPGVCDILRRLDAATVARKPVFAFATAGQDLGYTTDAMSEILAEKGALPVAATGCYAPENFVPLLPAKPHRDLWGSEEQDKAVHLACTLQSILSHWDPARCPPLFKYRKGSSKNRKQFPVLLGPIRCDRSKCVRCGLCANRCPYGAMSQDIESGFPVFDSAKCNGCARCVNLCPREALSHPRFNGETRTKYRYDPVNGVKKGPNNYVRRQLLPRALNMSFQLKMFLLLCILAALLLGFFSLRGVAKLVRRLM
eukprot:GAFH01002792.1.p1 GENE.GAFH01002792.1~~GAFH01002792.1.p1  ORF type:complete len:332 (+),score=7.64 GAFH01002792.1:133-996(+)